MYDNPEPDYRQIERDNLEYCKERCKDLESELACLEYERDELQEEVKELRTRMGFKENNKYYYDELNMLRGSLIRFRISSKKLSEKQVNYLKKLEKEFEDYLIKLREFDINERKKEVS